MTDRVQANRDVLLSELERGPQSEAQRRYERFADATATWITSVGGLDAAGYCLKARTALLWADGHLVESERRRLVEMLDDWPDVAVVDVLTVIVVLSNVGG